MVLSLRRLNGCCSARIPRWALALLIFAAATAVYTVPPALRGELNHVPEMGDGPDYENIGLELSRGHGFSRAWGDPEYRRPYLEANANGEYDSVLARSGSSLTTYRPPMFPLVICATYKIVGRQFGVVRLINCVAMAAACTLAAMLVLRRFGPLPAIIFAGLFSVVEYRSRWIALQFRTESLAALCVVLMVWCLLRLADCRETAGIFRRVRWAAAVGAVTGLAILVHSSFIFWFPLLAVLVYLLADQGWRALLGRARWGSLAAFLAAGCVVPVPWWVRNVVVLQAPMPFGTQGYTALYAGYSDEAVKHKGVWFKERAFLAQARVLYGLHGIEREKQTAIYTRAYVLAWIRSHPSDIPRLMFWKAYDLWFGADNRQSLLLLAFTCVGLILQLRAVERGVYLAVLLMNTLTVALTWSVGGRFLVPVLPVIHICVAVSLWALLVSLTDGRQRIRELLSP